MLSGSGTFQLGEQAVAVAPGSLMYVEAGIPHAFHSLAGDLAVLILWEPSG